MCSSPYYYKVLFESTGSIKYIRTSAESSTVIIVGGIEPRKETRQNPYPMDSGECFEASSETEFKEVEKIFHKARKRRFVFSPNSL